MATPIIGPKIQNLNMIKSLTMSNVLGALSWNLTKIGRVVKKIGMHNNSQWLCHFFLHETNSFL